MTRQAADQRSGVVIGWPPAFDDFYRTEYGPVVGLVYSLSGSRWAAEDLAQEAFLRAHRDWDRVGAFEHPAGWVRRVAINLAMSRLRRLAAETRALRRFTGGSPVAFPPPEPESDRFWSAVRSLPRRQAQVVALFYLEDRSVAQIAEVLDIADSAVKTALLKWRRNLETRLANSNGRTS